MEKRSCTSKTFLDSNQYTHRNIIKYERMFGETFVSTGGERTAKVSRWIKKNCQGGSLEEKNCQGESLEKKNYQGESLEENELPKWVAGGERTAKVSRWRMENYQDYSLKSQSQEEEEKRQC